MNKRPDPKSRRVSIVNRSNFSERTPTGRQNLTYSQPAPPEKRLYAFLVDFFIVSIPYNGLYGLVYNNLPKGLPLILHDLLFWLLFGAANTFFTARLGATVGKLIFKLKAVQHHSHPLTAFQFFLRETLVIYGATSLYTFFLMLIISGLDPAYIIGLLLYIPGFVIGLSFLLIFKKPPGLPLHDRIFKTGVLIADQANR